MELKEKDVLVVIEDKINFGDNLNSIPDTKNKSPIKGHVQIYEMQKGGEKKLIYEKDNLVVYLGREYVAGRILGITNPNLGVDGPTANEFICWYGLGSGGTYPGDPFDPSPPSSSNDNLNTEVPFSDIDTFSELGDFRLGFYWKHKLFDAEPADLFEQDINNNNRYLITKVQLEVGEEVANEQLISEAALFTAESNLAGYAGPFHMFARVTFPSIFKSSDRILFFVWYLYC